MAGFLAFGIIPIWVISGPFFHFDNTWQLIMGMTSSAIFIVMLYIIQNNQNRHAITIQLKLDEIILAAKGIHIEMMDIEKLIDEDLAIIPMKYGWQAQKTKQEFQEGKTDIHMPHVS